MSGEQYREESIRDAFITGLASGLIRQRLLENKTLDSKTVLDQARSLESAESYSFPNHPVMLLCPLLKSCLNCLMTFQLKYMM